MTTPTPCIAGGRCRRYEPGHLLHHIHTDRIRKSPGDWRDGAVRSIDERNVAVVDYLSEEGSCTVWHHHDLSVMCPPGTSVMVHERWHALAVASVVVNVFLHVGVGPVPSVASSGPAPLVISELATGDGVIGG